jgi:hypothetical protein
VRNLNQAQNDNSAQNGQIGFAFDFDFDFNPFL